ncbi:hypothetical protein BGZ49_007652 [Haplosporangium sp. Z 27]|nr:hypothetical protein BGZ49_007652 [Haplosporangium sp. Z 27]
MATGSSGGFYDPLRQPSLPPYNPPYNSSIASHQGGPNEKTIGTYYDNAHQLAATSLNQQVYQCDDEMSHNNIEPQPQYISSPLRALVLLTLTTLSTIVFTVVPVVVKGGDDYSLGHWYSWKDACRLIEPFCSGLLHTWFFYNSDLMKRWDIASYDDDVKGKSSTHVALLPSAANPVSRKSRRLQSLLSVVFTFFLMVYVAGACIHFAAALFKNTIVIFLELHSQGIGLSTHPLTDGDGLLSVDLALQLRQGYWLIQDVWEHTVSHYMYAFGALGMSWCEMAAYAGQVLPANVNLTRVSNKFSKKIEISRALPAIKEKGNRSIVFLWIFAGVIYGAIVAGVACQYPKGLYVGLIYVVLLLLVLCSYILFRSNGQGLFTLGRYYILQTYVIGGFVALVAIIIYMAVNHFDMLTSNDKSHIGSLRPPAIA